jgi:hypothetical protein
MNWKDRTPTQRVQVMARKERFVSTSRVDELSENAGSGNVWAGLRARLGFTGAAFITSEETNMIAKKRTPTDRYAVLHPKVKIR